MHPRTPNTMPMTAFLSAAAVAALLIAAAVLAPAAEGSLSVKADRPLAAEEDRPLAVKDIVERAARWVVAIRVERSKDLPSPAPALRALPEEMQEMRSYYERPVGWVSGVLVDAAGHVVTSEYNVAGEVASIEVRLPSGEARPARVVARSPGDDIALLAVETREGQEIPDDPPVWADTGLIRAGQIVFALGRSPDPSRVTVTRGILSATARNGGRAVQTDAELNYGNVGGPLVDLDGKVVAITGFVGHTRSQWGINSGVGFGTSAAALLEMLPGLRDGRDRVAPKIPFLGVRGARRFVDAPGAKVDEVVADGPASRAGLQGGDLILEFNGIPVESFERLRQRIFRSRIGEAVKLKVRRGEETLELEVTLGEMNAS